MIIGPHHSAWIIYLRFVLLRETAAWNHTFNIHAFHLHRSLVHWWISLHKCLIVAVHLFPFDFDVHFLCFRTRKYEMNGSMIWDIHRFQLKNVLSGFPFVCLFYFEWFSFGKVHFHSRKNVALAKVFQIEDQVIFNWSENQTDPEIKRTKYDKVLFIFT